MNPRKLSNKRGFTFVEIMIVVAIISLVVAIALPNLIKAKEKVMTNTCIDNLKQIAGAKDLYRLHEGVDAGDVSDLVMMEYIQWEPECPAGPQTTYIIGDKNSVPKCPNAVTGDLPDHQF
ncbi:MAG: prepilin-type N-terminal cleavage/methylation domain-containing protein [Candidatus Omnitrophica bacterium]|nr:prepilin-type N-terminal cleavage/methylation domain-containing protein [Candidatus Omnitrophota bacterium]MBU1785218.1 prepilin-type N-terminal cleavage/methylation domain-containing protein [Candidatus Omnitrophota bacterium]